MRLAMILFGNGYGMKEPYFDGAFYWLNDGNGSRARFYKFMYGYGAQLVSYEMRAPKAGTCRKLAGREYVVFSVSRGRFGLMCRATWSVVGLPSVTDGANEVIRDIRRELNAL